MTDLHKKQLEIEVASIENARQIYKNSIIKMHQDGNLDISHEANTLMKFGLEEVAIKIKNDYLDYKFNSAQFNRTKNFVKFLANNNAEVLAYIALKECIRCTQSEITNKGNLVRISISIANALINNNYYDDIKDDNEALFAFEKKFKNVKGVNRNKLIVKELKNKVLAIEEEDKVKIGNILIDLVVNSSLKLFEIKTLNISKTKTYKSLTLTKNGKEILIDLIKKSVDRLQIINTPMIVKPNDWVSFDNGGYLSKELNMIKTFDKNLIRNYSHNFYQMKHKVKVLNNLQSTKWRVNKRVLDVINFIVNNNVKDSNSSKFLPRLACDLPFVESLKSRDILRDTFFTDIKDFYNKRIEVEKGLDADNSRALNLMQCLKIAEEYKDYDELYFVYNFDTRYRTYVNQNFLSPQGVHYSKALLEFSEAEYLTDEGLKWLKIHIANVYGNDKMEYDDRVEWFNKNKDTILDIAETPLKYINYLNEVDSPFEFLAGCLAYMDYKNGKKIHLPIQLDATCSGLQIYSGLMLDKTGAENVNVINKIEDGKIKRADIYNIVKNKVNDNILKGNVLKTLIDKKTNEEISTDLLCKECENKIDRKLVKRNVMTLPYNATTSGMRDQLFAEIAKIKLANKQFWSVKDKFFVDFLLDLNNKSISENIKGAKQGQDFLNQLAQKKDGLLHFNTPLYKAPVFGTSLQQKTNRIKTINGHLSISRNTNKVNKRRQRNSFAPNFIHSLDAEILAYTVIESNFELGAIHDCFLMSANNAEKTRNKFKQGFIKVMKTLPLKQLEIENHETKVNVELINDLDLNEINNSEYIIS